MFWKQYKKNKIFKLYSPGFFNGVSRILDVFWHNSDLYEDCAGSHMYDRKMIESDWAVVENDLYHAFNNAIENHAKK